MNTPTNRRGGSSSRSSSRRPYEGSKPKTGGKSYSGSRSRSSGSRPYSASKSRSSGSRPYSGSRSSSSRGGYRGGKSKRGGGGRKFSTFNPAQFINKNPVDTVIEEYTPKNTFATFGFNEKLVKTIADMGLVTPSPIQDQIIPEILKGHDVIGIAETGTGKTAAFLLPIIEKTIADRTRQTLILAPTRELAIQIKDELFKLSKGLGLYSTVCVGGMNIRPQIKSLYRTNHFVIGTPGRIMDLMKRKHINAEKFTTVVLDEADRMLDMGFINDMRTILSKTPASRETLFFSATMGDATKKLVNDFLRNPVTISVKKKDVTDSIEQDVVPYGHHNKFDTLLGLLKKPEFKRVIIFGSMKHSVAELARELEKNKVSSESIHGNKNHTQRQRALTRFKQGEIRVLVATDVAARGIHVDDITHVINYDLPTSFDDYVHRIGRTGRGAKKGKALTFVQQSR